MFNDTGKVIDFLEKAITDRAVLVIGDIMLDRYYFGEVKRISPEAPVPVTRVTHEQATLGGAANVAHNLANLGCKVSLAGLAGDDESRRHLDRLLTASGIGREGLVSDGRPTITKLRVLGGHQQMLRLDFEENHPIGGKTENHLKDYACRLIGSKAVQAVIISDYAKGVCTPRLCQEVVKACKDQDIPLIIDPKGTNWRKYAGAAYITPNMKELAEAAKTEAPNEDRAVKALADKLRKRFNIGSLIVTRSEKGLSVVGEADAVHISTYAQEVFDVSGAGDTVVAVLGAALAAGMEIRDAAHLANLAAGIVVGKLGTYAVQRSELTAAVRAGQHCLP
ncbi:MAG TPA: D-glycero-beta-D-manno-heptose-7-phosphate kinase [Selenomonadales bacterium]|nr:D-glycero-beta-D-manno-heptose-7-phosphate kinase [Selenomonadales bacterium]